MAMVYKSGKMVPNMKETGCSIKHAVKANSGMLMEISSRDNGKMIKPMAMEFTYIRMVLGTKVNGKTISNTVMVKKFGQIIHNMKDFIMRVRSMVVASTSGRMVLGTTVNGMRIGLKAKVSTNGKMEERILDNGKIIICTVKVLIHGLMAGDTKANMKWIRNMDMVSIIGQMVVYTKEIGLMENNMVRVNTSYKLVK